MALADRLGAIYVVGQSVALQGGVATIIGVAPADFFAASIASPIDPPLHVIGTVTPPQLDWVQRDPGQRQRLAGAWILKSSAPATQRDGK